MLFKNVYPYRLAADWQPATAQLEEALSKNPIQPCSGMGAISRGWACPRDDGSMVAGNAQVMLITLAVEEKMLPSAVIKQETDTRAKELAKQLGYAPGRKMRRDLTEKITAELLPRAFSKRRYTRGWIDLKAGWLIIDASTANRAEELAEHLRNTLGELPVTRVETEMSAQGSMTQWVYSGEPAEHFDIASGVELVVPSDARPTVSYARHDLSGPDIRAHIDGGKVATRVELVWRDRASMTLHGSAHITGYKSLEMLPESENIGNPVDWLDAEMEITTVEMRSLLADLVAALGGFKE